MASRRGQASVAPRYGQSRIEPVVELPTAGSVRAHGIDNFPAYFCFQILDPRLPYAVALHVHTVAGKGRVSAVTGAQVAPLPGADLEQPLPAIASVMEDLSMDDFVADAVAAKVGERLGLRIEDLTSDDPDVRVGAQELLQEALKVANAYRPRRYNLRGPALLQEVAHVYISAVNEGNAAPTRAVQQKVAGGQNGYSTAVSWVKKARDAGLIPPAVKGRPGWKEDEA